MYCMPNMGGIMNKGRRLAHRGADCGTSDRSIDCTCGLVGFLDDIDMNPCCFLSEKDPAIGLDCGIV